MTCVTAILKQMPAVSQPQRKFLGGLFATILAVRGRVTGRKLGEFYGVCCQIEFLFLDSKQFTGPNDCQARAEAALAFHFNASLATLNLARAEELLVSPDHSSQVCSIAS